MLTLENAKKVFKQDIDSGTLSHAYMISSNRDNKEILSLVESVAKKLLETDNLKASPDYKYIEKKEDKKDLSVEQIRKELVLGLYLSPASSNYKVYVLNGVGDMNIESQNALLKSLEEPPKNVIIILIKKTSDVMLSTITSRVKEIVIGNNEKIDINKYVTDKYNIQLNKNMIKYSKYSYEKADELAEKSNFEIFITAEKAVRLAEKQKSIDIMLLIDKVALKDGLFLDYLENILYFEGYISKLKYIERAKQRLKQNGNEDIIKTMIAIELAK